LEQFQPGIPIKLAQVVVVDVADDAHDVVRVGLISPYGASKVVEQQHSGPGVHIERLVDVLMLGTDHGLIELHDLLVKERQKLRVIRDEGLHHQDDGNRHHLTVKGDVSAFLPLLDDGQKQLGIAVPIEDIFHAAQHIRVVFHKHQVLRGSHQDKDRQCGSRFLDPADQFQSDGPH